MRKIEQAVISLGGKLDPITKSIGWREGYGFKDGFIEFTSSGKVDKGFLWICDREVFEEVAKSMHQEQPAPVTKPDWKTAPPDAQFYSWRAFRKHENRREFRWTTKETSAWDTCSFDSIEWHQKQDDFEMRPESSNWNGQGLPPIGTICELAEDTKFLNVQQEQLTSVKEGSHIVVTGHSRRPDNGALNVVIMVVDNLGVGSCVANPGFVCRPIKSGRDKWIEACAKVLYSEYTRVTGSTKNLSMFKNQAIAVYNAGLAKLPTENT